MELYQQDAGFLFRNLRPDYLQPSIVYGSLKEIHLYPGPI